MRENGRKGGGRGKLNEKYKGVGDGRRRNGIEWKNKNNKGKKAR